MTRSRPCQDLIQIASRPHPDHIQTASRLHLCHTNFAKTILQPERRRREGQRLPDVWRSIIPYFRIFSVFLVVLNSLVFCVVSTVLRVRCYLHLRWHYLTSSHCCSLILFPHEPLLYKDSKGNHASPLYGFTGEPNELLLCVDS